MIIRKFNRLFRFSTSPRSLPLLTQLQLIPLLSTPNPLKNIIKQQLHYFNNQMKLSSYWELCLTHPEHGFYSQPNVFSKSGHFTTSPQISSIFGQIIGVWILHFIHSIAKIYPDTKPNKTNQLNLRPFRLIEFGPGRGLLMADVLRCIGQLEGLEFLESVTMIETSDENTKAQQKSVMDELAKKDKHFAYLYNYKEGEIFKGENSGIQLRWFKNLFGMVQSEKEFVRMKEVKEAGEIKEEGGKKETELPPFTIVLAHEFFDALPTESLIFTENGWRERVVSLSQSDTLVLKPSSRPLPQKLTPLIQNPQIGTTVQISPQSLLLMETLSSMISQTNGCILNIDYGNPFAHSDSIRAINSHKFVPYPHYLDLPGLCDLSAYVDFASLQKFAEKVEGIKGYGPIPQGLFLESMGINLRIEVLGKGKSEQVKKGMEEDYERLVSPEQMGEIYKVQMITCKENQEVYPFITQDKSNVF